MEYSIVIPVYNSSIILPELMVRLDKTMSTLQGSYEIIMIDDCSPDQSTWSTLKKLASEFANLKVIQLSSNFGQQAATICGFSQSRGNHVITMDDDLQHAPEDIRELVKYKDYDIVIGEFPQKKHGIIKRITSKIKGYFDSIIVKKPSNIQLTSFRMLSRNVVDGILATKSPSPFIPALMFHISRNAIGVPCTHYERDSGKSGYTLRKQLKVFSYLLINNSSLLLRVIGQIGLMISFVSFLIICYLVFKKISSDTVFPGWTSTIVAVFFFGGIQMLSIGIIGEYIIRLIRNSENRPIFHIKEIVTYSSTVSSHSTHH